MSESKKNNLTTVSVWCVLVASVFNQELVSFFKSNNTQNKETTYLQYNRPIEKTLVSTQDTAVWQTTPDTFPLHAYPQHQQNTKHALIEAYDQKNIRITKEILSKRMKELYSNAWFVFKNNHEYKQLLQQVGPNEYTFYAIEEIDSSGNTVQYQRVWANNTRQKKDVQI